MNNTIPSGILISKECADEIENYYHDLKMLVHVQDKILNRFKEYSRDYLDAVLEPFNALIFDIASHHEREMEQMGCINYNINTYSNLQQFQTKDLIPRINYLLSDLNFSYKPAKNKKTSPNVANALAFLIENRKKWKSYSNRPIRRYKQLKFSHSHAGKIHTVRTLLQEELFRYVRLKAELESLVVVQNRIINPKYKYDSTYLITIHSKFIALVKDVYTYFNVSTESAKMKQQHVKYNYHVHKLMDTLLQEVIPDDSIRMSYNTRHAYNVYLTDIENVWKRTKKIDTKDLFNSTGLKFDDWTELKDEEYKDRNNALAKDLEEIVRIQSEILNTKKTYQELYLSKIFPLYVELIQNVYEYHTKQNKEKIETDWISKPEDKYITSLLDELSFEYVSSETTPTSRSDIFKVKEYLDHMLYVWNEKGKMGERTYLQYFTNNNPIRSVIDEVQDESNNKFKRFGYVYADKHTDVHDTRNLKKEQHINDSIKGPTNKKIQNKNSDGIKNPEIKRYNDTILALQELKNELDMLVLVQSEILNPIYVYSEQYVDLFYPLFAELVDYVSSHFMDTIGLPNGKDDTNYVLLYDEIQNKILDLKQKHNPGESINIPDNYIRANADYLLKIIEYWEEDKKIYPRRLVPITHELKLRKPDKISSLENGLSVQSEEEKTKSLVTEDNGERKHKRKSITNELSYTKKKRT